MAPSRKEQYEKNAWSWVENCHPSDISDEHVHTAYRLNLSRCKIGACRRNCRGNPFCLSGLGEHRWLGSHEDAATEHIYDPEKERRKAGSYVGLKNLGATCYVNSLLQLWFHNLNFRKAIFMWDPLQDPEEKQNVTISEGKYSPLSVLGHLQSVFALMRYGQRRFVDPTDFILSLRLDTSIQQDAQEFSKLFLSKLESTLGFQSAKEVRDLIKDNFCGEYSYVTRCMKCKMESKRPSTFYELDLNIKGHKTIQDCLREFMNIEMLEGDDKYFCQVCAEKQDAQRFISLTELPPVLNLQLMRFVFDKNTGYKKKLNTFVQFPDKLNMSEFCPNVKGNMDYSLSAVLVHGGRSANSGHYVAHICDSESGTWYKFNDESVEKIEGKKLKLGTEDEYEDGGKKMKIPRAPKGSYHSPNAYMLVYTRNDVAAAAVTASSSTSSCDESPLAKDVAAAAAEQSLPSHLRNFVRDQNEQFENWVLEIRKTNDMTVGRNHHQQLEMATNITLLSVETDFENLEAIPTSWLTRWLSDPDLDAAIDNEKHACCHSKLDPNEVSNVKYINSEMADKLFDKHGGEPRFKYRDFLCRDCVIAKCLQIRVKNKTQEEFKIISNKLKSKFSDLETGYWVGKASLRSWRRMALANLENGVLDRGHIESLLLDDDTKYAKAGPANGRTYYGNSRPDEQMERNLVVQGSGGGGGGGDNRKSNERERHPTPRFLVISKLEECYALCAANQDDPLLRDVRELLKNILSRREASADAATYDDYFTKFALESAAAANTAAATATSYNGEFCNFLQNRDKTFQMNSATEGAVKIERDAPVGDQGCSSYEQMNHRVATTASTTTAAAASNGDKYDNSARTRNVDHHHDQGMDKDDDFDAAVGSEEGDNDHDHDHYDNECEEAEEEDEYNDDDDDEGEGEGDDEDGVVERENVGHPRRSRRRRGVPHPQPDQSTTTTTSSTRNGKHYDGNGNNAVEMAAAAAIATTTTTTAASSAATESQAQLNGGDAIASWTKRVAADNEDDGSQNSETKFNDDLLCIHGNLCVEENSRRLVPEQVWRLLKKYFPYAIEFTFSSQPCGLCKSIASEAEVAKDMYKTEAVSQKESLSDLYLDRNRPQLDHLRSIEADAAGGDGAENVFYIINKEFINSWRKFIRENGKKEPPYSIRNRSWLLCADHSGLLYDLNHGIPNTIVVITRKEWQFLCAAYNADCEINVKCLPDGTVVTSPGVCVPCMLHRIESEEKAQLCYAKAKIYIKVQSEEETDNLSNDESRPPTKRAKISTYNGVGIGISNGHGTGAGAGAGASVGSGSSANDVDEGLCAIRKGVNGSSISQVGHSSTATSSDPTNSSHLDSTSWFKINASSASIDHSIQFTAAAAAAAAAAADTSTCKSESLNGVVGVVSVASDSVTAVRRSSRCRRVRGVKEITVSSDLTLLDVKKKICEMMGVAPMDQHLFTSDGRSLTENGATLTQLSIYPETTLNLKVDEPCESVIADEFAVDREPEAGFKGTGLVGS